MLLSTLPPARLDEDLGLLVGALAPGVVGVDDRPDLAEVLDAPRHAGRGDRIGVGAGAERDSACPSMPVASVASPVEK